jgi:hypothetical protein
VVAAALGLSVVAAHGTDAGSVGCKIVSCLTDPANSIFYNPALDGEIECNSSN